MKKKHRVLIPRKCSGSWKAGQGIGYWRILARKNLVLQETVYMRTMYNKCHSFTPRFYFTRVHYIVIYKLHFKLLNPMLKTFYIKWVIKGRMSCQLVLIKWTQAILEVLQASLKSGSHWHGSETDFDMNGCEPGLILMKRLKTTQKWVFLLSADLCTFWNCSLYIHLQHK